MKDELLDRGQGRKLTLDDLTSLRKRIEEKIRDVASNVSSDDIKLFDGYVDNPQSIYIRKELLSRITKRDIWIRRLAEKFKADQRSIRKYVDDPKLLDERIERLIMGSGKARVLDGIARQIFVEGVRLLSTTIDDLVRYIPMNYLHAPHPLFKNADDRPLLERRVSRGTFYNEAKLCFDLSGNMTIKQMMADAGFLERIDRNLSDWDSGTIGVHAVQIHWQVDHGDDRSRMRQGVEGGEMTLLLMAVRGKNHDRCIKFELFPIGATSLNKARSIKEYINGLATPTRLVRLTSEMRAGVVKPTAIEQSVLADVLDDVRVEIDEATRGLGTIKVPKRFMTQELLESKLHTLLHREYLKRSSDSRLQITNLFMSGKK